MFFNPRQRNGGSRHPASGRSLRHAGDRERRRSRAARRRRQTRRRAVSLCAAGRSAPASRTRRNRHVPSGLQQEVVVLHIGVAEAFCHSRRSGLEVVSALVRTVRAAARRLRGVERLTMLYLQGQAVPDRDRRGAPRRRPPEVRPVFASYDTRFRRSVRLQAGPGQVRLKATTLTPAPTLVRGAIRLASCFRVFVAGLPGARRRRCALPAGVRR